MILNRSLDPFLFEFIRFFFFFEPLACIATLVVIYRRRLFREIPWFTIVMFEGIISGFALLLVWQFGTWSQYYFASWFERAVGAVLDFMVILDVIRSLLDGYRSIRQLLVTVLVVSGLVLLLIAFVTAPFSARQFTEIQMSAMSRFILTVDRGLGILQAGLIMVLFAVSSYLGLSWRNYLFGIPLGYGLYAIARLFLVMLILPGPHFGPRILITTAVAFILVQIVWLVYFLIPDPAPSTKWKPTAAADLERWDTALSEYLGHY